MRYWRWHAWLRTIWMKNNNNLRTAFDNRSLSTCWTLFNSWKSKQNFVPAFCYRSVFPNQTFVWKKSNYFELDQVDFISSGFDSSHFPPERKSNGLWTTVNSYMERWFAVKQFTCRVWKVEKLLQTSSTQCLWLEFVSPPNAPHNIV